jgi:hypothetical protein
MYDISGGSMWANKADCIISYYRPDYHIDKSSPNIQIHIQKVKRKRTGGKVGDFPLKLNWSIKRFVDPISGEPYCNPSRVGINDTKPKVVQSFTSRKPYIENNDLPDDTSNIF